MKLYPKAPSLFAAILILMISIPMLAICSQGGDGAEMVNAALFGGVLHPPGFPLQSWLDRIFIHLPFENPVVRLSFLSLLGHAGATFLVAEGLRFAGVHPAARVCGALAYGFYPSTWYAGVQPEVFAISHLCLAGAIAQALRFATFSPGSLRWKEGLSVSILGALSLSQSPITITSLPAFLYSIGIILKQNVGRRLRLTFICALVFFITAIGLYASLPLLRTQSAWPDWGKLSSASAIFDHFLRRDFGTFSLLPMSSLSGKTQYTALNLFIRETQDFWHVFALLAGLGLFSAIQLRNKRHPIAIVCGCFLSASLFLSIASAEGQDTFYKTMLERFMGTAVIPAAFLMGFGLDYLICKTKHKARWGVIVIGIVIFPLSTAIPAWKVANAANDCTLDIFREAISLELPPDALYISSQSEEYFSGIPQGSTLRFPLMRGQFFEYPWYRNEVLPRLEPRLSGAEIRNILQLKEAAQERGIHSIVSLDDGVFKQLEKTPELRGILYFSDPLTAQPVSEHTMRAALKLCPLIDRLKELPENHHGYSLQLRRFLARGFNGAAIYLDSIGKKEAALAAYQVVQGLVASKDANSWKKGCSDLISIIPR